MLFKSALVTQISGSIGGMTGSHNRGGLYFRARTIPADPNTPAQAVLRFVFASLVARWTDTLDEAQRDAWGLYAAAVPLPGPLGDPITVSGQNMYIRSNTPRFAFGIAVQDTAPSIFDRGLLNPTAIENAAQASQEIDITFQSTDLWNLDGGALFLFVSRPLSPAINFFRGPYRFAGKVEGNTALPPTSPESFSLPFAVIAGQRLFARARASFPDGRLTNSQFLGPLTVVA